MRSTTLTVIAAAIGTLALLGCAHERSAGADHVMMAKAGGKGCFMGGHENEGRAGGGHDSHKGQSADRGEKNMSGCRMMGTAKKDAAHNETADTDLRDPHADHRP